MEVDVLHVYRRADLPDGPISGGSGPKDYMKNQVWEALFGTRPDVEAVAVVRGRGSMFFLGRDRNGWFDVSGKQVVIEGIPPG
jgi:hypothetical protein